MHEKWHSSVVQHHYSTFCTNPKSETEDENNVFATQRETERQMSPKDGEETENMRK